MTDKTIEVKETPSEKPNVEATVVKAPSGQIGRNIKMVTETFTDTEKRAHFMTHDDMEPHRYLAILLGLTVVITIVLAIFSANLSF